MTGGQERRRSGNNLLKKLNAIFQLSVCECVCECVCVFVFIAILPDDVCAALAWSFAQMSWQYACWQYNSGLHVSFTWRRGGAVGVACSGKPVSASERPATPASGLNLILWLSFTLLLLVKVRCTCATVADLLLLLLLCHWVCVCVFVSVWEFGCHNKTV